MRALVIRSTDPAGSAAFWGDLLGWSREGLGQLPEEGHIVLADPDDNEFCVIEAGNNCLAGTGLLGEVAADGTRDVGLFWAAAIDWPLVWDEEGETEMVDMDGNEFVVAATG